MLAVRRLWRHRKETLVPGQFDRLFQSNLVSKESPALLYAAGLPCLVMANSPVRSRFSLWEVPYATVTATPSSCSATLHTSAGRGFE